MMVAQPWRLTDKYLAGFFIPESIDPSQRCMSCVFRRDDDDRLLCAHPRHCTGAKNPSQVSQQGRCTLWSNGGEL